MVAIPFSVTINGIFNFHASFRTSSRALRMDFPARIGSARGPLYLYKSIRLPKVFAFRITPNMKSSASLQDENDPAYNVARKVKEKFPDKPISIVVERCNRGLNPKVNNLFSAYLSSKYATVLISDSNVKVDRHYLKEIAFPRMSRRWVWSAI